MCSRSLLVVVVVYSLACPAPSGFLLGGAGLSRVWLAGALSRVASSLADRARVIGSAVEPEAAAIEWAVGRVMVAQFARVAQRV